MEGGRWSEVWGPSSSWVWQQTSVCAWGMQGEEAVRGVVSLVIWFGERKLLAPRALNKETLGYPAEGLIVVRQKCVKCCILVFLPEGPCAMFLYNCVRTSCCCNAVQGQGRGPSRANQRGATYPSSLRGSTRGFFFAAERDWGRV